MQKQKPEAPKRTQRTPPNGHHPRPTAETAKPQKNTKISNRPGMLGLQYSGPKLHTLWLGAPGYEHYKVGLESRTNPYFSEGGRPEVPGYTYWLEGKPGEPRNKTLQYWRVQIITILEGTKHYNIGGYKLLQCWRVQNITILEGTNYYNIGGCQTLQYRRVQIITMLAWCAGVQNLVRRTGVPGYKFWKYVIGKLFENSLIDINKIFEMSRRKLIRW